MPTFNCPMDEADYRRERDERAEYHRQRREEMHLEEMREKRNQRDEETEEARAEFKKLCPEYWASLNLGDKE